MDALEKSLLIRELNDLTHALDSHSLSFYEIARSKKRIHEIFALCDEPIFQKQILSYKALVNPIITAQTFAEQTLYSHSFRGIFENDSLLEDSLYEFPEAGWAFLYKSGQGWQIWLIPAPQRTALISEWDNLEQVYRWMLEQVQLYHCLKTNQELEQLAQQHRKRFSKLKQISATPDSISHHYETAVSDMTLSNTHSDASLSLKSKDISAYFRNRNAASAQLSQTNEHDTFPAEIQSADSANIPRQLQLGQHEAQLVVLNFKAAQEQQLYALNIAFTSIAQYADLLIHAPDQQNMMQHPVYLSEQISAQGRFIKYLVLFAVDDEMQAIRLSRLYAEHQGHELASVRQMSCSDLLPALNDQNSLFEAFSETTVQVWSKEDYFPFIPQQLIHTQKFIQFEETAATLDTPVILLRERQKIRVIHGQNRLNIARMEQALPHLLLDRQNGISWQLIQRAINRLQQPIDALQLYEAIQVHAQD